MLEHLDEPVMPCPVWVSPPYEVICGDSPWSAALKGEPVLSRPQGSSQHHLWKALICWRTLEKEKCVQKHPWRGNWKIIHFPRPLCKVSYSRKVWLKTDWIWGLPHWSPFCKTTSWCGTHLWGSILALLKKSETVHCLVGNRQCWMAKSKLKMGSLQRG